MLRPSEPGIAEQPAEEVEPSQRQARRRIECVRVQHAQQRDVHEEAFGSSLCFGKFPVLEVGTDDACVVSAVPVAARRSGDELKPQPHRPRRGVSDHAARQRHRFASVLQQPFVHGTPPPAAGRRGVERIEQAAVRLPAHERQCRPSERQVSRCGARRPVIGAREQGKTCRRIVAYGRDLSLGPGERTRVPAHRRVMPAAESCRPRWIAAQQCVAG